MPAESTVVPRWATRAWECSDDTLFVETHELQLGRLRLQAPMFAIRRFGLWVPDGVCVEWGDTKRAGAVIRSVMACWSPSPVPHVTYERSVVPTIPAVRPERDADLMAERDRLAAERDAYREDLHEVRESYRHVIEQRNRLRAALAWYADPESYLDGSPGEWVTHPGHPGSYTGFSETEFEHDHGQRARDALCSAPHRSDASRPQDSAA
jgi:hypothetical protein